MKKGGRKKENAFFLEGKCTFHFGIYSMSPNLNERHGLKMKVTSSLCLKAFRCTSLFFRSYNVCLYISIPFMRQVSRYSWIFSILGVISLHPKSFSMVSVVPGRLTFSKHHIRTLRLYALSGRRKKRC